MPAFVGATRNILCGIQTCTKNAKFYLPYISSGRKTEVKGRDMKRDEALTIRPGTILEIVSKDHEYMRDFAVDLTVGDIVEVEEVMITDREEDILENVSPAFKLFGRDMWFSYLDFEVADADKQNRYRRDKGVPAEVVLRREARRRGYAANLH